MPKLLENHPPLQSLRIRMNLEPETIAETVSIRLGKCVSVNTLISWERRGTRNIDYIKALSYAFGLPEDIISEAAKSRNK